MYRRQLAVGALAAFAAAALTVSSPTAAVAQKKLTPVRAAYVPVATWLPAWVAKDKGIFEKHGLDVSLTPTQNLSLLPGTVGKQFEFAASTPPDLIKAAANGLDVVATAGEAIETKDNQAMAVIVRKDSGIKGPKDLKGKTIAAPTLGAVMHVATLYWLKKNGVDPNSIRGVEVPFPNMGDQLKAKNVDAVEALVPFTTTILAAGNLSIGDPMLAVGDEVLFPFWISSGAWARANRPIIKAWIDSLTEAKVYMDANPKEARAVLAKYSRLPPAIVEKVPYPTYRFTIKPEELGVWVDVLNELGQLAQPVDKNKLVVTAP
ncbi:MAG: PhnD/SsuA/transferrin family substrate-binding protein [Alphaproteobacteria bacterium]|nr:PhnD/SsuA/transferrin family substrate-binding protein [Alphaproteobacteria bacterium]